MAHPQAVHSKNAHRFAALTGIAIALCLTVGPHQALAQQAEPSSQSRACPSGYGLVNLQPAYCFSSTGDVVEPMAILRPASAAGCRKGYDRLGGLCLSPATGDVELAETPTSTHASR